MATFEPFDDFVGEGGELSALEEILVQELGDLIFQAGDIIYHDGSVLQRRGIGSTGQVLTVVGGVPVWANNDGSGDPVAPTNLSYVVLASDGTLTNERVLTGTANQIILTDSGAGGNITLSLPQNIHTGASPTFAALTLTAPLAVTSGGTGFASYAVGDLLYASTTTALSKLADVATGNALISGGVNTAPAWGKVALTTHISGILPIANGGTNASSFSSSSGLTYFNGTSLVNSANFIFNGTYPSFQPDADIFADIQILTFGVDNIAPVLDGTSPGLYWSGPDVGNTRLEFKTLGATGYNVWSTTFTADNFTGGTYTGNWAGNSIPLGNGGTGASLADPNADQIFFWDDSAGSTAFLATGNSLAITTTTLDTIQDIRTTATPQFTRLGLGAAASATASRLILLTGSGPEIQWINTASSNKSWHLGSIGNLLSFTETGVATTFSLLNGGGARIDLGGLTILNGIITQSTATGANTFTGSITCSAITYTAAIRQMNVASGVTIMEYNFLPLATALNAARAMRFFRETNTGTGVGSILFNIGVNTSLEAFTFILKNSVIAQMSAAQSETGNWTGNHRIQQLAGPTASVAVVGVSGATTYSYRITALTGSGETTVGTAGTTTTGNAVLSASNYNRITWARFLGCMVYKVYGRTSGSELLMATVTGGDVTAGTGGANYDGGSTFTFEDIGSITPSGAQPTANTTGRLAIQNSSALDVHIFRATGESVFNEQGADQDFRVEGDTDTSLFFVDASTDRIGIGTNTPLVKLDHRGSASINGGFYRAVSATKTTTYTATVSDHLIPCDATSAAFTVTLPSLATSYSATTGTGLELTIIKIDASVNAVTIDGNGSETINGATTQALAAQWNSMIIQAFASGWYIKSLT